MKNLKKQPDQKEFIDQAHLLNTRKASAVATSVTSTTNYQRVEDVKHNRRYSFDDNGGGYLGL